MIRATASGPRRQRRTRSVTHASHQFVPLHEIPEYLTTFLSELDAFIAAEITPLEQQDDNIRFFDHRREDARTDWERGGLPREEWEELLAEARRRADAAGFFRYQLPRAYGGRD